MGLFTFDVFHNKNQNHLSRFVAFRTSLESWTQTQTIVIFISISGKKDWMTNNEENGLARIFMSFQ